jgi:two-component sensor histidine kinase
MQAKTTSAWTMPAVRVFAYEAGALLLICAGAAAVVVCMALLANAHATRSLPDIMPIWWIVVALGILEIVCSFLIWRIFLVTRRRFAQRLQAATGGLDDRIFVADANGTALSVLTASGWIRAAMGDWLDSIHLEDRTHWPVPGATGSRQVELRLKDRRGEWRWHRLRTTPLLDGNGAVREWVGTIHDIHDQKQAGDQRDLVIAELRHRLKNLLTVIDALARNSRRSPDAEPGVKGFLERFLGRLHALGTAGDLVLAGNRVTIDAGALIGGTLAPFLENTTPRIHFNGPSLLLTEEAGGGLGLAVHELATNAVKYGALSVPDGKVSFTWAITQAAEGQEIAFVWKETGGPPPVPPSKPGFGTRLIKFVGEREKSGRVDIEYPQDGLYCRIAFVRMDPDLKPQTSNSLE